MKRVAKWSAISLFAVLVLIALALGLVLGTQAGSRWALGLVPGLQVDGFQGRLAGLWQAEKLVWQSGEDRVELTAPLLEWTPGCLLRRTLAAWRLATASAVSTARESVLLATSSRRASAAPLASSAALASVPPACARPASAARISANARGGKGEGDGSCGPLKGHLFFLL